MRYRLITGLTLLCCAAALGADKPIPQDTARMEKRYRERLEWNRRTLGGAYEKVGKKDPRWDGPAHEALDLSARLFSQQVDPVVSTDEIHVAAKKAVDAGCDDPMILYLYARTSTGRFFPKTPEYNRRLFAAADAMTASAYPPYRRAVAVRFATEQKAAKDSQSPDRRHEVERGIGAALDLLTKSLAEDPRDEDWEERWFDMIIAAIRLHRMIGVEAKTAFDRVDARLVKIAGIEGLRLAVKGYFFMHWGWEARTQAFAPQVTDQQFRTFDSRLEEARASLNAAWKAKSDQPHVAALMIEVEKGIGGGDRAAMETWFERAMQANGNDRDACWSKLDWLDPKWYGGDSWDALMAFGKACRATGNWRAGITLLAADAHLRYSSDFDTRERATYLRRPEVWADIQPVYDEYLKHFTNDDTARSKYAAFCYISARYPQAHEQFQILGDRLMTWREFPFYPLESLKRMREDAARFVAGKPRQDADPAGKGDNPAKP